MDEHFSPAVQAKFDELYKKLKGRCRVIPERLFTEMWLGLDKVHYIEEGLSPYGKRSLTGFEIAAGLVIQESRPNAPGISN